MGLLGKLGQLGGKLIGKAYALTPWGKKAAADEVKRQAQQAGYRKAIAEGGEGAVDIARQTVGRNTKGSTFAGAPAIVAIVAIGIGMLFPPTWLGLAGGVIAGAAVEKGAEAAMGVLAAPATPTPKPEKKKEEEPEPDPQRHSNPGVTGQVGDDEPLIQYVDPGITYATPEPEVEITIEHEDDVDDYEPPDDDVDYQPHPQPGGGGGTGGGGTGGGGHGGGGTGGGGHDGGGGTS